LADEPDRAAGQLVGDLTAEGDRLGGLAYDGHWSVRAAFDLSYRRFGCRAGPPFRLLPLVPGGEVGVVAAAALVEGGE
jgi:hypothetical protein